MPYSEALKRASTIPRTPWFFNTLWLAGTQQN
jgi:hypothetical protein